MTPCRFPTRVRRHSVLHYEPAPYRRRLEPPSIDLFEVVFLLGRWFIVVILAAWCFWMTWGS